MIIVHQFDIGKVKSLWNGIFPKVCETEALQQTAFKREYDFVMIGPKIGVVVIEVKNTRFTGKTDFNDFSNSSAIRKGITQLKSFDTFIEFLQRHPDIGCLEKFPVRKILVLPNLTDYKKDQFEEWKRSSRKLVNIDDVWPGDQPFTTKFQNLSGISGLPFLSIDKQVGQVNRLDRVTYEKVASIISGLGSIVVFKGNKTVKLDLLRLLEGAVIKIENEMILSHNPAPLTEVVCEEKIESYSRKLSRVLVLTLEQEKALAGPNRQFVIDVAGTGKTIVLQQKALQVLRDGGKVLIMTADCFIPKFRKFINQNSPNSKNCSVFSWIPRRTLFEDSLFHELFGNESTCQFFTMRNRNQTDLVLFLEDFIKKTSKKSSIKRYDLECVMPFLSEFDAVLIDDACDYVISTQEDNDGVKNLIYLVLLMAYAKAEWPWQTVWVALDSMLPQADELGSDHRQAYSWALDHLMNNGQYEFASVVLTQILRHSDNIFRFIYNDSVLSGLKIPPFMGHKIAGPTVTQMSIVNPTKEEEALHPRMEYEHRIKSLWMAVKSVLGQLIMMKISLSFICILTTEDEVVTMFSEKWEEYGLPVESMHRRLVRPRLQMQDVVARKPKKLFDSGDTFSRLLNNFKEVSSMECKGTLSICHCLGVSSLEWPVVIFCSTRIPFICDATERYRAYSRATTKLIEVSLRHV